MRPELETLYPRHEVFLALLHRADTSGEQTTSTHEIDAVCTMMRRQFGDDLVLCADGATLVAALGPTGDELVRTGRVPIAADCRAVYPRAAGENERRHAVSIWHATSPESPSSVSPGV